MLNRTKAWMAAAICLAGCGGVQAAALDLSAGQSVTFNTSTGAYSGSFAGSGTIVGGAAVFEFDSINLAAGSTVNFTGTRAVSLRSTGDILINTLLSTSGGNGTANIAAAPRLNGAGGGGVNIDGFGTGFGHRGFGTGDPNCCGGGGGAGYGGGGGDGNSAAAVDGQGGISYGDSLLATIASGTNLLGGSGGGGGTAHATGGGGGGGAGGIELLAGGTLTVGSTGSIQANGGNGGGTPAGVARGGGGGSGGTIRLQADAIAVLTGGLVSAEGGDGGDVITAGRGGGGGGGGRILFVASSLELAGVVQANGELVSDASISVLGGDGGTEAANAVARFGDAGSPGTIMYITAIPEPATVGVVAMGLALFVGRRRAW